MNKATYRYPGPQPFAADQHPLFFGREEDIEGLYQLVSIEKLVVLYSKSGLGKSSLINAGIIPKLEEQKQPQPLTWRFGAYTKDQPSPVTNILERINPQGTFSPLITKAFGDEPSLWKCMKEEQLRSGSDDFLIIIDQFEELFTYPEADILAFKQQLSAMLYTEIPNHLREHLEDQFDAEGKSPFSDAELEQIHHPFNVRLLLAIRSDRMSLLNNLTDYLPDILRICYELKALSPAQAEEAILNPAFLKDERYITPTFDYEDDAIETIVNFLSQDKSEPIESFQLQILCQFLEKKVNTLGLDKIREEHLEDLTSVFENYYDNQIDLLDSEEEKLAARRLIEEALIFEEEERRLSLYEGQIYQTYGFSPELLQKLSNVHLLRAEPSLKGGYTYEIPHDTLVAPILKAKKRRLAAERAEEERRRQAEREAELRQLQAEKDAANRKRRRAVAFAIFTSLLAAVAILATLWAVRQSGRAKAAEAVAVEEKGKAEDLSDSLRIQLSRYLQARYDQLLAEGRQYQNSREFGDALLAFRLASAIDSTYLADSGQQARDALAELPQTAAQYEEFNRLMADGDRLQANGVASYRAALNRYAAARGLDLDDNTRQAAQNKIDALQTAIRTAFNQMKERASAYLNLGNNGEACRLLRLAADLMPGDPEISEQIESNCQ